MPRPQFPSPLPVESWRLALCLGTVTILWFSTGMTWAQTTPRQGVAVLNDGRVFQGSVEEVPGGYRVQYPGGSSILPFNQISVTSATLVEAYEAFRDNIQTPSADAHLKLAEWCLVNGLYSQADAEVQSALRLEPMRTDAIVLLKQIDAIIRPGAVSSTSISSTSASPGIAPNLVPAAAPRAAMSAASFIHPSERNPTGLSRETQLLYMRKVQPLLMNKCGNAGCHGPNAENQMKLMNARYNSHGLKLASEHNLDILFQLIDFQRPERSSLLRKPRELTPEHQKLFAASWQQPQFEILQQWVEQVAQERDPALVQRSTTKSSRDGPQRMTLIQPGQPIQQVSGVSSTFAPDPPGQLPSTIQAQPVSTDSTPQTGMPPASPPTSDPQFLEQIRQAHRPDAFDPEIFNRMMHSPKLTR